MGRASCKVCALVEHISLCFPSAGYRPRVGWSMEKNCPHEQIVCFRAGSYTTQGKQRPCQQGVWDRNVGCLYLQSSSSPGLGFCTVGTVKNTFFFFNLSIYVGRPLFLRFLLGRKKKRKRCCLVIKGRTILVLASSCIVWWVLCLRNAGDVLSYYALASLKLQQ